MFKGAAYIVVGNLVSKLAGFGREVAFAGWFGTGPIAAGFRIAQTAYLLPAQALVGDSLGAGLLPLYREMLARDKDAARMLVLIAAGYATLLSALLSIGLFVFTDDIVRFLVPGAGPKVWGIATELLVILSFATPAFLIGGMLSYLETSYGKFGAIAWRPLLLNIGSLAGAALAYWTGSYHWLATAILASHLIFVTWTVVEVRRLGGLRPQRRFARDEVVAIGGRFIRNALSLLSLPLIVQSTLVVERIISSHLGTSVIASVDYARFLADTTVQLIAMPLGVMTMASHGGQRSAAIDSHVAQVAVVAMVLATPVAALMLAYPEQVTRAIFARGAFDEHSVQVTAALVRYMGGAVFVSVAGYYLIKALNAQLRNREALIVVAAASLSSIAVNALLWRVLGVATMGVAVASYSLVSFAGAVWRLGLWRELRLPIGALAACLLLNLAVAGLVRQLHGSLVQLVVGIVATTLICGAVTLGVPRLRVTFWSPMIHNVQQRLARRRA
ncbi:murein biosynthesis integral membrane protein MurJ [Sphingomonas citri]